MSNAQLALPGVPPAEHDPFRSRGADADWVWSEETEEEAPVFVHATVMKDEVLVALGEPVVVDYVRLNIAATA